MEPQTTAGAGPSSERAGSLTPQQMDLVLRHLPLQVSIADENDILVYWHGDLFEDCEERWIGKHVNDCHAPGSRPTIDRMIREFRAGTKDEAVFRRDEDGRLILVRYVAVRDDDGAYRGIMETMQDITDLRFLHGEQLELDWE